MIGVINNGKTYLAVRLQEVNGKPYGGAREYPKTIEIKEIYRIERIHEDLFTEYLLQNTPTTQEEKLLKEKDLRDQADAIAFMNKPVEEDEKKPEDGQPVYVLTKETEQ